MTIVIKVLTILLFISIGNIYASEVDCSNPITTIDINLCKYKEMKDAEKTLNKYLHKSKEQYKDEEKVLELINKSQQEWLKYRKVHCDAIYQIWVGGTIRGLMHGQCMVDVTKRRTHELWKSYLTFMDSTPPILPEPK